MGAASAFRRSREADGALSSSRARGIFSRLVLLPEAMPPVSPTTYGASASERRAHVLSSPRCSRARRAFRRSDDESFASSPEVILDARALVLQAFRRNADREQLTPETRIVLTAILRACREAVRPFDATCRRDKALLATPGPEAAYAIYRLGQWRILNDAIHVLEYALRRRKRKWRKHWERRRRRLVKHICC